MRKRKATEGSSSSSSDDDKSSSSSSRQNCGWCLAFYCARGRESATGSVGYNSTLRVVNPGTKWFTLPYLRTVM
ncbi:unnamed protein product [Sphagnum balticum]